jgi:hypothetical protein
MVSIFRFRRAKQPFFGKKIFSFTWWKDENKSLLWVHLYRLPAIGGRSYSLGSYNMRMLVSIVMKENIKNLPVSTIDFEGLVQIRGIERDWWAKH